MVVLKSKAFLPTHLSTKLMDTPIANLSPHPHVNSHTPLHYLLNSAQITFIYWLRYWKHHLWSYWQWCCSAARQCSYQSRYGQEWLMDWEIIKVPCTCTILGKPVVVNLVASYAQNSLLKWWNIVYAPLTPNQTNVRIWLIKTSIAPIVGQTL